MRKTRKTEEQKVKYYYFCATCPEIKITAKRVRILQCGKCARTKKRTLKAISEYRDGKKNVKINKDIIKQQMNSVKNKKTKVTKKSRTIDKITLEKIRDINKKHRENEVKKIEVVQRKSDVEMIAEFLQTHKIKREVERPISEVAKDLSYTTSFCSSDLY